MQFCIDIWPTCSWGIWNLVFRHFSRDFLGCILLRSYRNSIGHISRRKPLPCPKSLATFAHALSGDSYPGSGERTRADSASDIYRLAIGANSLGFEGQSVQILIQNATCQMFKHQRTIGNLYSMLFTGHDYELP